MRGRQFLRSSLLARVFTLPGTSHPDLYAFWNRRPPHSRERQRLNLGSFLAWVSTRSTKV
jgi:hypothetical protein